MLLGFVVVPTLNAAPLSGWELWDEYIYYPDPFFHFIFFSTSISFAMCIINKEKKNSYADEVGYGSGKIGYVLLPCLCSDDDFAVVYYC